MSKLENLMDMAKINELLGKKQEEKKKCNVLLWVLAIIGVVAAVAGICYAVYRYFTPDYLEDFEDDFDDDFEAEEDDEDDFFEDESVTNEE
ncbi:MAG: hypothetical protein ACI4R5_00525 [Acetatifactor sp.]